MCKKVCCVYVPRLVVEIFKDAVYLLLLIVHEITGVLSEKVSILNDGNTTNNKCPFSDKSLHV
jgi:hypothetical protein